MTGPSADSVTHQLGGWSVSWQGVFDPGNHVCCMGPPDQIPPATTVLKGLAGGRPERDLRPGPGRRAVAAMRGGATPAVVVVGERAYAEGLGDRPDPVLPPEQQSLISALEATGKPVIIVVIAGRPLGFGPDSIVNDRARS